MIACGAAIVAVVAGSFSGDDDEPSKERRAQRDRDREPSGDKEYVVQSGDTLSQIALETGVSIEEIERLNPDIDVRVLNAGQVIELR